MRKTWKGRLSYRLTAVTIWCRGVNHTVFIYLPVDHDGKVRCPESTYNALIERVTSGQRGRTICPGGVGFSHL